MIYIKKMVINEAGAIVHIFRIPLHFVRNKYKSTITRSSMDKVVKKTYDKRIVHNDFTTRAFGTKK